MITFADTQREARHMSIEWLLQTGREVYSFAEDCRSCSFTMQLDHGLMAEYEKQD